MTLVALGLGSNREPRQHLEAGLQALQEHYGELQMSEVFESEPVGFTGPNFLNLVVTLDTGETLTQMLHFLKRLEMQHGRRRDDPRFSDRTLDIDILIFGDLQGEFAVESVAVAGHGTVILPRPEVVENAYVLRPLAQVLGAHVHPPSGMTYAQLWGAFEQSRQRLWPAGFSFQQQDPR